MFREITLTNITTLSNQQLALKMPIGLYIFIALYSFCHTPSLVIYCEGQGQNGQHLTCVFLVLIHSFYINNIYHGNKIIIYMRACTFVVRFKKMYIGTWEIHNSRRIKSNLFCIIILPNVNIFRQCIQQISCHIGSVINVVCYFSTEYETKTKIDLFE